jgi:hypothetical protein
MIFSQKNYPVNFAKTSTLGVNFINVLPAYFTCADPKSIRFQLSRQYHFTLLESAHVKAVQKNVDEIDTGSISSNFTHKFFVQKCFAQLSLVMFQLCNFWRQNICSKFAHKILMKLSHCCHKKRLKIFAVIVKYVTKTVVKHEKKL